MQEEIVSGAIKPSDFKVLFAEGRTSPENPTRFLAPCPIEIELGDRFDYRGFQVRHQTDGRESYAVMLSIFKKGILRPFRELPEYGNFLSRHKDRVPTEELLTHVFQYRVVVSEGEKLRLVEIATFSPYDHFTVNREPYEPPPFIPEYRAVREGSSIQYMDVTDVGKRAYRADTITWVDITFPSAIEGKELFIAEMTADIAITTR